MSIRTTVTLDDDVLERVKQQSKAHGKSFRETLNELVRQGLLTAETKPQRPKFKVKPSHMGSRPGLNYDDIEGLISYGEGEDHR